MSYEFWSSHRHTESDAYEPTVHMHRWAQKHIDLWPSLIGRNLGGSAGGWEESRLSWGGMGGSVGTISPERGDRSHRSPSASADSFETSTNMKRYER